MTSQISEFMQYGNNESVCELSDEELQAVVGGAAAGSNNLPVDVGVKVDGKGTGVTVTVGDLNIGIFIPPIL